MIALVTGASQGIGAAVAEALVTRGHRVVLAARNAEKLSAIGESLGPAARATPCDITDPAEVDALYQMIARDYPRLDLVFNNAGVAAPDREIADLDWEDWRRVLSVNLDGAFLIARGAYGLMRAQSPKGGRIINNGSVSAHAPRPRAAPYAASKHALTGLTKVIALDGRAHGIACGQIDIGNVASDMTAAMAGGVLQPDGSIRAEPMMDVAQVAAAVVFMAELPLEANVLFQTLMATNMPFVGRG